MKKIEQGEEILKKYLDGNIRLRLHGDIVRIEADPVQMKQVLDKKNEIVRELKQLGFLYLTLDLEGFRSGSMDQKAEMENATV